MARTPSRRGDGIRRRPKDRKAQIARASAEAFSELGYHGVSMEAIASRVGISAAALYRHYSSKYDLFRDAVLNLGQLLVDSVQSVDTADDPAETLRRLATALTDAALASRDSGGLYRWEARYLRGDDQATLDTQLREVHRRIQAPLCALRPDLGSRQRWTLSTAVLSVIGSIVDHGAKLPGIQIRLLMADIVSTLAGVELPDVDDETGPPAAASVAPASKYEALLSESLRLFNDKGYRDTTVEDIASAVGMPASGIYRYFSGKSDILAAGFRRSADRLSAELSYVLSTVPDREAALTRLIDAYVERSFAHPELDYVYYTERLNMTPADQEILRNLQRSTIDGWVGILVALRPEYTTGQARFAVYAAMALMVDLGRLMDYRDSDRSRATIATLMDLTLLGRYRLRTVLPAK